MKTAFDIACDAYQLRKEVEHRARLRALQHEMTRWPLASPPSPQPAATPPRRGRAQGVPTQSG